MRYPYTDIGLANIYQLLVRGWDRRNANRNGNLKSLWQTGGQFLPKLNKHLPHTRSALLSGIYQMYIFTKILISMSVVIKNWKLSKHPGAAKQIVVILLGGQYYPATQRNELQNQTTAQIQLRIIILNVQRIHV